MQSGVRHAVCARRSGRAFLVHLLGLLAAGAILLGLTAQARAAPPFQLGPAPGYPGDVAVDEQGTAHVVWADDVIRYCQVPRGRRGCARQLALGTAGDNLLAPQVLLPGGSSVVVLASGRCFQCDTFTALLAFGSEDGGATFAPPRQIGTVEPSGDARLGPGQFAVSVIEYYKFGPGGVLFQVAPLTGTPAAGFAALGAAGDSPFIFGKQIGSIAFVDPLTPIVAMTDSLDTTESGHSYFRRFAGGTDYNNEAAWGPLVDLGVGDQPKLAGLQSGKKGVQLLMRVRTNPGQFPQKFRYVARRYRGSTFLPQRGVPVSEVGEEIGGGAGTPALREFFMDPGGRVHALWINSATKRLRHRASSHGVKWKPTENLVSGRAAEDVTGLESDAARDGGGLLAYNRNGTIWAVTFGPQGPVGAGGGAACVDSVKVQRAIILAQEGCFRRKGDRYTTRGDVRVNGIDLDVGGGGSAASASATPSIVVERGERTLVTSGKVRARIGNVVLGDQKLSWRLPKGDGEIRDLAGNPAKFDTSKFQVKFLGLPVSGYTVPSIAGLGRAKVPINVALPQPFDSVLGGGSSAATTLRATNETGLQLSGVKFQVSNASFGIARLGSFDLEFIEGTSTLRGRAQIMLPVSESKLTAEIQLTGGEFDYGKGDLEFPSPGIPVATDIFLRSINFSVQKGKACQQPTRIAGGVLLVTGPEVAGYALLEIPGGVSYSFPRSQCGLPGIFEVGGQGKLVGLVSIASVTARYSTVGQFTFKGSAGLSAGADTGVGVQLDGGIDLVKRQFYAAGKASGSILGYSLLKGDAIVSGVGMAACVQLLPVPPPIGPFDPVSGGFAYRWGESIGLGTFDFPPSCDTNLAAYKPTAFQSRLRQAGGGGATASAGSFAVSDPQSPVEILLDGATDAPGFVLTGPGAQRIEHPGGAAAGSFTRGGSVVPLPALRRTVIRLSRPAPGSYTVDNFPGAPPIAGMAVAEELPPASVRGRLRRYRSGSRVLRYGARGIGGQTLRFVEQGPGVIRILGRAKRPRGTLRFRPAPGPAGRRSIYAIVERSGMPRQRIRVARFRARRAARPGRPRRVRLRRRGSKLVVSWRRAPRASRYAVGWRLRDGRRGARLTRRRRLVLGKVPGIDAGTITVAGLRRDNVAGRVAKAKLRPKPKRRRARRSRRRR